MPGVENVAERSSGKVPKGSAMGPTASAGRERIRDADRTRGEILEAARSEFARIGFSGSRVDEVARLTNTTKGMIYYYFGSKEGLYVAVLESAYVGLREDERMIDLDHLPPIEALRTLTEATFDSHDSNPDFVRLVSVENIHSAEHLEKSSILAGVNSPILDVVDRILERGRDDGSIRRQASAVEVHITMSSFCFYRVANRSSIRTVFGYDMADHEVRTRQRRIVADLMVAWLTTPDGPDPAL